MVIQVQNNKVIFCHGDWSPDKNNSLIECAIQRANANASGRGFATRGMVSVTAKRCPNTNSFSYTLSQKTMGNAHIEERKQ